MRFPDAPGTLAHAYFPPPNGATAAGDAHFDKGENWQDLRGTLSSSSSSTGSGSGSGSSADFTMSFTEGHHDHDHHDHDRNDRDHDDHDRTQAVSLPARVADTIVSGMSVEFEVRPATMPGSQPEILVTVSESDATHDSEGDESSRSDDATPKELPTGSVSADSEQLSVFFTGFPELLAL